MKRDDNGKWPMPTQKTIPEPVALAALVAWHWLAQSRTGFTELPKLSQAADVEIYLVGVLKHRGAMEDGELVERVIMEFEHVE